MHRWTSWLDGRLPTIKAEYVSHLQIDPWVPRVRDTKHDVCRVTCSSYTWDGMPVKPVVGLDSTLIRSYISNPTTSPFSGPTPEPFELKTRSEKNPGGKLNITESKEWTSISQPDLVSTSWEQHIISVDPLNYGFGTGSNWFINRDPYPTPWPQKFVRGPTKRTRRV